MAAEAGGEEDGWSCTAWRVTEGAVWLGGCGSHRRLPSLRCRPAAVCVCVVSGWGRRGGAHALPAGVWRWLAKWVGAWGNGVAGGSLGGGRHVTRGGDVAALLW